jgi:DNA polymerase-3 subunit alpha
VTLGGIVTTCKKVRTKSGNQLLFATLDDIEGQIEMLVFKAEESGATAAAIAPDTVVLVRGRLDHKVGGETKLVVQEAQRFEPGSEEIARATAVANAPMEPLKLTIDAAMLKNPALVDELKSVFEHHKGEAEVHLAIRSADGNSRQIKLGKDYRVRPSSGLRAELGHVLGSDSLAA